MQASTSIAWQDDFLPRSIQIFAHQFSHFYQRWWQPSDRPCYMGFQLIVPLHSLISSPSKPHEHSKRYRITLANYQIRLWTFWIFHINSDLKSYSIHIKRERTLHSEMWFTGIQTLATSTTDLEADFPSISMACPKQEPRIFDIQPYMHHAKAPHQNRTTQVYKLDLKPPSINLFF